MPSAVALVAFSRLARGAAVGSSGLLHGLLVIAVAVVAQAVWTMARTLAPDAPRASVAVASAVAALLVPSAWTQILIIVAGAVVGVALLKPAGDGPLSSAGAHPQASPRAPALRRAPWRIGSLACLAVFAALLTGLPIARAWVPGVWMALADSFYRVGALVFGGGHVVLPLLQREVVPAGLTTNPVFLAGYGAAQAVPGPLFTFAAYLGAVAAPSPGLSGAALALVGIFLPGMLLLAGALPFWDAFRRKAWAQAAMRGVNAAVVGLLGTALYDPVFTTAVRRPADFGIALGCFVLLVSWRLPPLAVVALGAAAGALLPALGGPAG